MHRVKSSLQIVCVLLAGMQAAKAWSAEVVPSASVRFDDSDATDIPDFQRHVVPLLGRLGCNGRNCHGSFQGRGGFRLSLFGYDFEMDHQGLIGESSNGNGQRVDFENPDQSLILRKPTMAVEHEGGERFLNESWEYRLLNRWIEHGSSGLNKSEELVRLDVFPKELLFSESRDVEQLKVIALWKNGDREDVTPLCRFRSNDDSVASVDQDGEVTSHAAGDTHVVAFYDNGIGSVPVIRPNSFREFQTQEVDFANSPIDQFVIAKLNKLKLTPSKQCTDSEFLRRVSIDLTGTLPTTSEVKEFLHDDRDDKRERKIDELLNRPAYAAWWANKLCDYTGCNPQQQAELGQELSVQWYMWIFSRLQENIPYDELIRRVVLAQGRHPGQTIDDYAAETSAYFNEESGEDFSQRETMPHYWTRRSMQEPDRAAEAFAHNFLGIRLQCAQCHKHPFAQWTQADYQDFSQFFETVKFGVPSDDLERYRELAKQVGMNVRGESGSPIRNDALSQLAKGRIYPWRELYIQSGPDERNLSLLRSGYVTLQGKSDPRQPIMKWMSDPGNPWFARAFVNRVWASYFHKGIVEPPDDLNPANPPSHPNLLDWLAENFVKQRYDMKWLHREIVSSQTYQRSWRPNHSNQGDRTNFSRFIPRRISAEVVYDGVKQVVAAGDQAEEVRSDLTRRASGHLSMRLAGTYAMQVFGKPERAVNCDCERNNQPTLLQTVFLQNDPIIEQRIDSSGWIAEISERESQRIPFSTQELIEEAWLRTLCRMPTKSEVERSLQHCTESQSVTAGIQDLLWALINTKEFLLVK